MTKSAGAVWGDLRDHELRLIAHWRLWWRRASTWMAALNAMFVAYVFSQPVLVVGLIGFAPGEWIVPIAVVAALMAFGLPVMVAQIKQPKLAEKRKEIDDASA